MSDLRPTRCVDRQTRGSERIPVRGTASFKVDGRNYYGWIRNISLGGVYFGTNDKLPLATVGLLNITIPQGEDERLRLAVDAQVCRRDEGGLGLCFYHVPEEELAQVQVLVDAALRAEYEALTAGEKAAEPSGGDEPA
jgi:hypothetical protein